MRALKIVCGVAVVILSLHMVHAIHHFHHMQNEMSAGLFWGGIALAVLMDALSLVGGIVLLMGR